MKRRSESRLLQLAILMVSWLLLVMAVTSYILYNGTMEHERRVLLESVEDQRYFIEAFGHGAASGPMKDEMLLQLLAPVIEAQRRVETHSRATEMLLGKRLEDGRIWLLINPEHLQNAEGPLVQEEGRVLIPSGSALAIPMQRALNGEEGTITAMDYRGREVVAAYTSVRIFGERFGLVAKVERSRIYEHLIQMAWKVGGCQWHSAAGRDASFQADRFSPDPGSSGAPS